MNIPDDFSDLLAEFENERVEYLLVGVTQSLITRDRVYELKSMAQDNVVFVGVPPLRIDFLLSIPGVDFDAAYARRTTGDWNGVAVSILSVDDLITNKKRVGRKQDLADVQALESLKKGA